MAGSLMTLGLRASVRGTRGILRTTRELADLGLAALDLVDQAIGEERPRDAPPATPRDVVVADDFADSAVPADADDRFEPDEPVHIDVDAELVEEVADPGAQDGAGASIRIDTPLAGYDKLRAADLIARLPACDIATLGAIELYEGTHRRRRTVLDAVTRELRRRG